MEKRLQDSNLLHNIIMESRRKLSVSGVEDVDSFNENEVIVYTNMGLIEIKGNDIHMNKLNLDSGEIILEGEFDSVIYIEEGSKKTKKGLFAKIFNSEE